MKRLLALFALSALPALAADEIVLQTAFEDGTTNSWTQADLVDALGLMNRKYHRDMASESGRVAWHGKRLQQYAMTNGVGRLQVVSVYSDGYAHTEEAKAAKVADPEAAAKLAAERRAQEQARLAAWEAANLPPELAALRSAQRAAAVTNEVTVIVTPAE